MFCLCFLFVLFLFGTFVFETSCILGVSLVRIVLLGFLGSIFVVFCLCFLFVFSFWDFCFGDFVHFKCFLGLFSVGFFGSIFVVFCLCVLFVFLFLGLLFLRLRAF